MTDDEKLMAFADGELSGHESTAVQIAIGNDARLKDELARERRLRRSLSDLYDPVLGEELPESLTKLLTAKPAPGSSLPGKRRAQPWWLNVTATAASLAAGVFLGQALVDNRQRPMFDGPQIARGELTRALDAQLASAPDEKAPIQLGISFFGPGGHPCRTFRSADLVGLACRDRDRWTLRLMAPTENSPGFEYQQADSASALVMRSAQEMMVGEPMDAVAERRARDSGWPSARQSTMNGKR